MRRVHDAPQMLSDLSRARSTNPLWITAGLLLLAIGWDVSGLDLVTEQWFGGSTGFPLRNHWFLTTVLHEGGRVASWLLLGGLFAAIRWPVGCLTRLDVRQRWQLALSCVVGVLVVSSLKSVSATSCPWDLAAFGQHARYVSHWDWRLRDGSSGHCFPAGHASAGFALVSGYFVFRDRAPGVARAWLIAGLCAGLLLGLGQQIRGAHFMSHTLWAACACWCAAGAVHIAFIRSSRLMQTWRAQRGTLPLRP